MACTSAGRVGDDAVALGQHPTAEYRSGRLTARVERAGVGGASGLHELGTAGERGGILYVPAGRAQAGAAPLLLLLHGAGGAGSRVVRSFISLADSSGTIIVAPDSRGPTWDFIRGPYGPDVAFIDSTLRSIFACYDVDRDRVTVAGFSDGASYALSLGMTNGDLFERVVAFSPGMAVVFAPVGRPRLFIAHGTEDEILPIDRTSRVIVPRLRAGGYDVHYREFAGPHAVLPDVAREAFRWMANGR